MSRGPGNIQRRLLSLIESDAQALHSTHDLAANAYDIHPNADGVRLLTEAQVSSVRRALTALAKQGKISGRRGWYDRRQRWATAAAWAKHAADQDAWRRSDRNDHWVTLAEPRQRE
jgi:hypothetical protein